MHQATSIGAHQMANVDGVGRGIEARTLLETRKLQFFRIMMKFVDAFC